MRRLHANTISPPKQSYRSPKLWLRMRISMIKRQRQGTRE